LAAFKAGGYRIPRSGFLPLVALSAGLSQTGSFTSSDSSSALFLARAL
jgi:hypothetical protein